MSQQLSDTAIVVSLAESGGRVPETGKHRVISDFLLVAIKGKVFSFAVLRDSIKDSIVCNRLM